MATDEEKGEVGLHYVTGFGSLADFVAGDPDRSTHVYRRFDRLAARDLLYYQSELAHLEDLQNQYDMEDALDIEDPLKDELVQEIRDHAQDWQVFDQAAAAAAGSVGDASDDGSTSGAISPAPTDRFHKRRRLAMDIRRTLKEYREALLQQSQVLSLEQPSHLSMKTLSSFFHQRTTASFPNTETYVTLAGASRELYPRGLSSAQVRASDYLSLSQEPSSDLLTYLLKRYGSWLFRVEEPASLLPRYEHRGRPVTHLSSGHIRLYSMRRIAFSTTVVTVLIAAGLLLLPIFVLYDTSANQPAATLGLIALFTSLFAGSLAFITSARKAEIFGACAAYAAVLVVFVSGDLAKGGGD